MSNGKFCIFCGAPLKDTAKFCASCGNAAAQPSPIAETVAVTPETQPAYAQPTYEQPVAPQPVYERPAYEQPPAPEPDFSPPPPAAPPQPQAAAPQASSPQAPTVPPQYLRPPSYNPTEKLFGELAGRTNIGAGGDANRPPARRAAPIRRRSRKKWLLIGIIAGVLALGAAAYFLVLPMFAGGKDPLELGNNYLADLEYDMAIEQFERLAEAEPDNARAYTGMAEAYIGKDDIEGALEALELGIENTGGERAVQRALDKLRADYGDVLDGEDDPENNGGPNGTGGGAAADTVINTVVLRIGSPNMTVNGISAGIDSLGSAPMLSGGNSLLPLRGVLVALGGDTQYDSETGSVRAILGELYAVVSDGNETAFINGAAVKLPIAPAASGGSMFVPTKLFIDAFGASSSWDNETQSVTLTFEVGSVDASRLLPPT
jgi:hypothetical protein